MGIVATDAALERAEDVGLDLVEISPSAEPPVCKILDYGRFKYQDQKKKSEARKKTEDHRGQGDQDAPEHRPARL